MDTLDISEMVLGDYVRLTAKFTRKILCEDFYCPHVFQEKLEEWWQIYSRDN